MSSTTIKATIIMCKQSCVLSLVASLIKLEAKTQIILLNGYIEKCELR
jgi:hypothetical protein